MSKLEISGITDEGFKVVKGCLVFTNSVGIPLDILIDVLYQNKMLIDWIDYYDECVQQGQKQSNLLQKIENALVDVFGKKYKDEVIKRIRSLKI